MNSSYQKQKSEFNAWDYVDLTNFHIDQDSFIPTCFLTYYPTKFLERINGKSVIDILPDNLKNDIYNHYHFGQALKYKANDHLNSSELSNNEKRKELLKNISKLNIDSINKITGQNIFLAKLLKLMVSDETMLPISDLILVIIDLLHNIDDKKVVIIPFPSSKGNMNIVSHVARIMSLVFNDRVINGAKYIKRVKEQEPVHDSNETRSITDRMKLIQLSDDIIKHQDDILLCLDDVTTSGSSLEALNRLILKKMNVPQHIINFVYCKSIQWNECIEFREYEQKNNVKIKEPIAISNIIWDLDNTLVSKNNYAQYTDELIPILQSNNYQNYLVTNKSKGKLEQTEGINIDKYNRVRLRNAVINYIPNTPLKLKVEENGDIYNVFSREDTAKKEEYTLFLNKPSKYSVLNIKNKRNIDFNECIGVGNNESDIIAYHQAGMYAVLVNWGNEVDVKNNCGADKVFNTVDDFSAWLIPRIKPKLADKFPDFF